MKPLITLFQPQMHGNGLDRYTINLAKALVEFDVNIDLVVPAITEYHQEAIATELPANVRSITLDSPADNPIPLQKIWRLKQYLQRENPDVLLASADYVGICNAAQWLSGTSTQVFHAVHIHVSHYFAGFSDQKAKLRPFLLTQSYRSAAGVIAVSVGVAKDLIQTFKLNADQVQVIYNPVVTPDLLDKAKDTIVHPWFAPGQPPVILGAGRLMHQKDFSTLIRAFAKVCQQRPCRLMILGEWSEHKAALDALIQELHVEDDVELPGFIYNPYPYMVQAAVFAMSSCYEGFGNVLVEAMAVGTPVVSTNCESGPAEILEHGKYGALVPVGNANALAEAILQTLDRPLAPTILQARAAEFSSWKIAKQYLQCFQIN